VRRGKSTPQGVVRERLTAFAQHLLARGVRLAYHHHMGAYV
jgi:hypothetical protein